MHAAFLRLTTLDKNASQCFSRVGNNWFIETRGFVCFQIVFFYGETTQYVIPKNTKFEHCLTI